MEFQPISGPWAIVAMVLKNVTIFTVVIIVVAYTTLAERKVSAWIQDRRGPNRAGPFGLLQPVADGIKNFLKEETLPATASRFFFLLAPILVLVPSLVTFAVIPIAAPLPTPAGVVDMIIADVPIGILYVLALSSLAVYGVVLGGWSSNNKYAFLGALRASAQMVSFEVALGLSIISVLMLSGSVTLPHIVAQQQLGMWYAFPLSLGFILFVISAFAETNRLPFDMPEAESELVTGYHTEYSAMKFSAFMIGEFGHMVTASALMATLFLGGWDIPFWQGDNAFWFEGQLIAGFTDTGAVILATPAVWKTLLTFGAFSIKTGFFIMLFIWVRWTLPRFRYDQVMALGWKVMLPTALAYLMLIGGTILVLEELGMTWGFTYGLALTAVSGAATFAFVFSLDRGRIITGAAAQRGQKVELRTIPQAFVAGDSVTTGEPVPAGD